MTKHVVLFLACLVACFNQVCGYKVLLAFPIGSYSHHNLGLKLLEALVSKGHEVTLISSVKDENFPKSSRHIYLKDADEFFAGMINPQMLKESRSFFTSTKFLDFVPKILESIFAEPALQNLVKDPKEKFDVVVVDELVTVAMKVFAYHFNSSLVAFGSFGPSVFVNQITGNPYPWSYVPNSFLAYGKLKNMWERIYNAFVDSLFRILQDFFVIPSMDAKITKYFPGAPGCKQLNDFVSIVLLNSHVSTNSPVPILPNMIEIGGYHVDPPKKLPKDLQKYLDDSKNGVVYFSMGSIFKGIFLDEDIRNAIMKNFAKLDLNVLWKFENETIPGQPQNVKLAKWVPQQDVLAHPNVKLFITHGGLLSTIEAVYHGVPLLGIPTFGDQIVNIANAVDRGYAVRLDLDDFAEDTFSAALHEILTNPRYTEAVKRRQKLMLDRQMNPKETAVYWIEYAARHKGEKHFRSAALDLAWYELYMVDALIFVTSVILTFGYLSFKIIKYIINRRRKSAKKTKQS